MKDKRTIVVVLRSGGDFKFRDVELIARHINGKWQSEVRPRIICLWDKATEEYDLGNIEILPMWMPGVLGTWSRIQLFSPQMEQYKPFLYVDLDTAIIQSLENILDLVKDETQFITLEDFWQRDQLATGLVWYPKDCKKTQKVWKEWKEPTGKRMDVFLRQVCQPDIYWQSLTSTIKDFKPANKIYLNQLPADTNLVCFHGKPRILESDIIWVKEYVNFLENENPLVTVIIPYNKDRGWLNEAILSVPKGVQLLLSKGDGNWPENFNKVLHLAKGKYIRWLHEDDMLTPNGIEDSVKAIEEQGVDFVHGNVIEISRERKAHISFIPNILYPTIKDLMRKNTLHSASMMYRKEVFDKVGKLNETLFVMEEYEFNLRCLKAGLKLGYCASTVALYRRHNQQKIMTVPKIEKDKEKEMVNQLYR